MTRLFDFCGLGLAALAFVAVLVAAGMYRSDLTVAAVAVVIAAVLAVVSYRINRRVEARSVPRPITLPDHIPLPFVVRYRSGPWVQLLAAAVLFGGGAFVLFDEKPVVASFSGLFGILSVVALLSLLRRNGTSALSIDEQGVRMQTYGTIPWSEIDRAYLQTMSIRGQEINSLILEVYEPGKYLRRDNMLRRLIRRFDLAGEKNRVGIRLDFLSGEPRYIDAVVRHVRAKYAASIGVELKAGDLSIDQRTAEINKLMASVGSDDDLAKQRRVAEKVLALSNESLTELRQEEKNIRRAQLVWGVAIAVAFVLLIASLFLKR